MTGYNKNIFIKSAIITIIVFFVGIIFGKSLEQYQVEDRLAVLRESELDTESYFQEKRFLGTFGADPCILAKSRISKLLQDLQKTSSGLLALENKNFFGGETYDSLLRRHIILQVRTYTTVHELNKQCEHILTPILFFYGTDNFEAEKQGYVLDRLQQQNVSIAVFSISKEYTKEPLVATLVTRYNITTIPTLIINDQTKLEGYHSIEELMHILNISS